MNHAVTFSRGNATSSGNRRRYRIILTTSGSYGDIHPYIAIGLGLRDRGHDVVMATSEVYRSKIEALGLGFHATRPDSRVISDPAAMRRFMDPRMGTVYAAREIFLASLPETYSDLVDATQGADLLVSHLPWAARLVAEKTGIPWVSTMITPMGFFSVYDLPMFPITPGLSKAMRCLGPGFFKVVFPAIKWLVRPWAKPFYRLRKELGLPRCRDVNPLDSSHSPRLVLALFSRLLAAPQPDWPPNTIQTGFPTFDQDGSAELSDEVTRFLQAGPPPVIFTLAMSAAMVAKRFFPDSIAAAQQLKCRAIFVTGRNPENRLTDLPSGMMGCEYAPFSKLFPHAAAIVHPGGIGTTGLALRSGRPALVVPFAHDQPDNAERCVRLGTARTIFSTRYNTTRAVRELQILLDDPKYTERATEVAKEMSTEDGVKTACDALEQVLTSS